MVEDEDEDEDTSNNSSSDDSSSSDDDDDDVPDDDEYDVKKVKHREEVPRIQIVGSRSQWLEAIRRDGTAGESARMKAFLEVFREAQHLYPDQRVSATSEETKTLDIVALILKDEGKICVQYDGILPPRDRAAALKTFQDGAPATFV
ncbi:hypothetical protein VC83_06387 [Pseudogymnoascus destructans]|uniref:Uncharacterized protein n=2 Tax=Pseudogymnoascus destructans TaxID=655981 RepID=L8GBG5_PSED2|nr:uncharacterized protein VC83_06387 [Pseudogymnoascus destructans]ELR09988.1 hypothetical protein GMDG_00746 [Pseudogymnoascus destructans 20631-21]OAF58188.1 hypothetical protein VC83_06387 [Pseudogymnoascus destructans]